jgi:hypothetical protein
MRSCNVTILQLLPSADGILPLALMAFRGLAVMRSDARTLLPGELRRWFYCVLGRRHGATRSERLFQPIGFNPRTDPPLGPLSIGSCSNTVEKKRKKRKLDNGWRARRVLFDLSVTEWRRKVEGKAKDVLVERDDMPSLLLLA